MKTQIFHEMIYELKGHFYIMNMSHHLDLLTYLITALSYVLMDNFDLVYILDLTSVHTTNFVCVLILNLIYDLFTYLHFLYQIL